MRWKGYTENCEMLAVIIKKLKNILFYAINLPKYVKSNIYA